MERLLNMFYKFIYKEKYFDRIVPINTIVYAYTNTYSYIQIQS